MKRIGFLMFVLLAWLVSAQWLLAQGEITTKGDCFDQNGNTVPLANVVTSSGNCKLGVNFNSGGTLYKLLMSPFPLNQSGDAPATCPSAGCLTPT